MQGHIYVYREGKSDYYKIGKSVNGVRRGRELQTGNHRPLTLVYLFETLDVSNTEIRVHSALAKYHVKTEGAGTEWFKLPTPEIAKDVIGRLSISPKSNVQMGKWADSDHPGQRQAEQTISGWSSDPLQANKKGHAQRGKGFYIFWLVICALVAFFGLSISHAEIVILAIILSIPMIGALKAIGTEE